MKTHANIIAGTVSSNKFRGMSRAWFVRKTAFGGALGAL